MLNLSYDQASLEKLDAPSYGLNCDINQNCDDIGLNMIEGSADKQSSKE